MIFAFLILKSTFQRRLTKTQPFMSIKKYLSILEARVCPGKGIGRDFGEKRSQRMIHKVILLLF